MFECSEHYRLRKMARYTTGKDVLDIGYAQWPNPYIHGVNLVGLDIEKKTAPANYSATHTGDAFDLPKPFMAESFDCLVAGEILEHVKNPVELLEGFFATLKPGGTLVLSTPNPHSPVETLCNMLLNKSILYTTEHITLYPQRWLLRMLEIAGFSNLQLKSGGIQFPLVGGGRFPGFGLIPFPRPFCYQTIAIATKPVDEI